MREPLTDDDLSNKYENEESAAEGAEKDENDEFDYEEKEESPKLKPKKEQKGSVDDLLGSLDDDLARINNLLTEKYYSDEEVTPAKPQQKEEAYDSWDDENKSDLDENDDFDLPSGENSPRGKMSMADLMEENS